MRPPIAMIAFGRRERSDDVTELSSATDLSTRLSVHRIRDDLVVARERACVLASGKLPRHPGSVFGFSCPVKFHPRLVKPRPNRLVLHDVRTARLRGARNRLASYRPSDLRCGQRDLQHASIEFVRCDAA